jgi:hypothetical protein
VRLQAEAVVAAGAMDHDFAHRRGGYGTQRRARR